MTYRLAAVPNVWGCYDPQCLDSTWDHPCSVVPEHTCELPTDHSDGEPPAVRHHASATDFCTIPGCEVCD